MQNPLHFRFLTFIKFHFNFTQFASAQCPLFIRFVLCVCGFCFSAFGVSLESFGRWSYSTDINLPSTRMILTEKYKLWAPEIYDRSIHIFAYSQLFELFTKWIMTLFYFIFRITSTILVFYSFFFCVGFVYDILFFVQPIISMIQHMVNLTCNYYNQFLSFSFNDRHTQVCQQKWKWNRNWLFFSSEQFWCSASSHSAQW